MDTEQCPEDHDALFLTAQRRVHEMPPSKWLYSYGVKGVEPAHLYFMLTRLLRETKRLHGGVYAVILDGVADFVLDANDPRECNPFVTLLEAVATDYDCSVIAVLHLNPSPANQATKSRGHLGSQLERKCETDLRLTKDANGVTTVFTACARRSPIAEKDGLRFEYDVKAGMHVTLEGTSQQSRDSEKTERLRKLAEDIFWEKPSLRYSEITTRIESCCGVGEKRAEQKFSEMKRAGVIVKKIHDWGKAP